MKNNIILTIVSIVVIIGFLGIVYKFTSTPQIYPEINKIQSNDNLTWSPNKKNILVEYSDIQCPACKTIHDYLKTFEAKNITLVFRHYPLTTIHKNALPAAQAAEAAGKQKKFFPMLDALFSKQTEWSELANPMDYFVKTATNLKLNVEKFKTDYNSKSIKDKVAADIASGDSAGITSTPTFFLNGEKVEITSLEEFKNVLLQTGN